MKDAIKLWWKQFTCDHDWHFNGHAHTDGDTAGNKESYWYWHLEKCDNCGKEREVMNNPRYDECGYLETGK